MNQKDVLNKLTRNEQQVINPAGCIFFRDVYDHLLQLDSLLDDMIMLVGGALDTYLPVVNIQMSDIMKMQKPWRSTTRSWPENCCRHQHWAMQKNHQLI